MTRPGVPPEPAPPTPATELSRAVAEVQRDYPLPRCKHDKALRDHAGNRLEPSCGCREPAAAAPPTVAPARPAAEIAWGLVLTSAIGDIALSLAERKTISKVIAEALERDRASRSPGRP